MDKIKIVALFGESNSGKDTILNWLINNYPNFFKRIVGYTTRPPRDYEVDGKDYHFISEENFLKMQEKKEFLEFSKFNNWYYGTSFSKLSEEAINVGVFNLNALNKLLTIKTQYGFEVIPIWIKADDKIRMLRALSREKNPNCYEICRRFIADKKDFKKIDFYYKIFYNNNDNDYNYNNIMKLIHFLN